MLRTRRPTSSQAVVDRARQLRRHQTRAEQALWHRLRKRQLGAKFRRQVAIGPFIVDFYCPAAYLIVEIDGDPHEEELQAEHDKARTEWLEERGFRVLRFRNSEVDQEVEAVVARIAELLPLPRSAGEGLG